MTSPKGRMTPKPMTPRERAEKYAESKLLIECIDSPGADGIADHRVVELMKDAYLAGEQAGFDRAVENK